MFVQRMLQLMMNVYSVMVTLCIVYSVYGCSWFDHIKTWYSHKDDMNMLFITYEEMIQVGVHIMLICMSTL